MNYLNIFLAFLSLCFWVGLLILYKREFLHHWYQNRFVPDADPEVEDVVEDEEPEQLLPFDYQTPKSKLFEPAPVDLFYENSCYKLFAFNSAKKLNNIFLFMPDLTLTDSWEEKKYPDLFFHNIAEMKAVALAIVPIRKVEEAAVHDLYLNQVFARAAEWLTDYHQKMLKNQEFKLFLLGNSFEFYKIISHESAVFEYHYEAALAFVPSLEEDYEKILSLKETIKDPQKYDKNIFLDYDPRAIKEEHFCRSVFQELMKVSHRAYKRLPLCYYRSYKMEDNKKKSDSFFYHLDYLKNFINSYDVGEALFKDYVQKRRHQCDVMKNILLRAFEKEKYWLLVHAFNSLRVKDSAVIAHMIEGESALLRDMVKHLVKEGYEAPIYFLIEMLNLPHHPKEEVPEE